MNAQSPTQSDIDPTATSTTPVVPPGGAAPVIVTRGGTASTQSLPPIQTTLPDPVMLPPLAPSAGMTIVNAPFGASVPYYGGLTTLGPIGATGGIGSSGAEDGGIGIGSFTLTPILEMNVGTDSNVYATSTSPVRSFYTTVSPTFDLRSNWSNHMLHVLATATFGWYNSASSQNYQNYGILVDGQVDIHSDIWALYKFGFRRATEALGTPDTAFSQAPTVVDSLPIEIGLHQEFNDFFYEIGLRAIRYFIYDNGAVSSQMLPADDRNRWEYGQSLRLGYHLNPDVDLFVSSSLGQVRYLQTINIAGQQRNSGDFNVNFGATWKINPISFLDANIGWQNRNDPTSGYTSSLAYALNGTWTGYAPLTLRPTISRTINETALSQYTNFVNTTYAIDATYEIHNEWTLAGGLLFQTADYTPAPGSGVGPRTDYFFRGQFGVLYSIRPEIQIGPFFEYSKGSSTDPLGPAYDRQVFSIRLIAKR